MGEIIQLASGRQFRNMLELKEFCEAQFVALHVAQQKLTQQEEKINHLQDLLEHVSKTDVIIKTQELCLVEDQIRRLSDTGMHRQLTSEEIKSLDILIKNKALLTDNPTTISGEVKNKKKLTPAQLTIIAKQDK